MDICFLNVSKLPQYLPGQKGIFLYETDKIVASFHKPHPDFHIWPFEMLNDCVVLKIFGVKQHIVEQGDKALQFIRYILYNFLAGPSLLAMIKHNGNNWCELLLATFLAFPHIKNVAKEL